MPSPTIATLGKWLRRIVSIVAMLALAGTLLLAWLLYNRPRMEDIAWPTQPRIAPPAGAVTATWLGVSTVLFDDGNTQILIDGFFSRPSLAEIVFDVPVVSDAAGINYAMDVYGMQRLAAIIPVHSHFDHAMDIGAIANRSSASVLGSATTAQIARGAGVPEDQIVVVADRERYEFGEFTVTLIESVHAPIAWGGTTPLPGSVDAPLETPAPISAWREGGSYTILVAHTQGSTLVQGSAGYRENGTRGVRADVTMLGTFGLEGLGNDYARKYWQTYVTATGARRVYPLHFDDYTRPFGEIAPFPRVVDDFEDTAILLENIRQIWDTDTRILLPEFGQPIVLYPQEGPEA